MKKVIEEFTGMIGVGCLAMLGLFFLTDSVFRYWYLIELLTKTNSWAILISIPILIVDYILGLIIIELGELFVPKLYAKSVQHEFEAAIFRVMEVNKDLLSNRYAEINQNRKILNGSSIGFILVGVGVFFEGLPMSDGYRQIGIIGLLGSLVLAVICPLIGYKIQQNFNKIIKQLELMSQPKA